MLKLSPKQIEGLKRKMQAVTDNTQENRQRVLSGDFDFFCREYFSNYIFGERSTFQRHFINNIPNLLKDKDKGCKKWFIAPRGECKSTLLSKILPLYAIVSGEIKYIILVGADTGAPKDNLKAIKYELVNNQALSRDFPEVCGMGDSTWGETEIITSNNVKITTHGIDQTIRGKTHLSTRPQIVILDDPIKDSHAQSEVRRERIWDTIISGLLPLGNADGSLKFFAVGTVLHNDDPISRAKRTPTHEVLHFKALEHFPVRMDLWEECMRLMRTADKIEYSGKLPSRDFYETNKEEMDRGAVTSWQVRTIYDLMSMYAASRLAFMTEMQGEPPDATEKIFSHIEVVPALPAGEYDYYLGIDPSNGGDPFALVLVAKNKSTQVLYILDTYSAQKGVTELRDKVLYFMEKYQLSGIFFESNGGFESVRRLLINQGLPLHKVEATLAQGVRIQQLEPFLCSGNMVVVEGCQDIIAQFRAYPEKIRGHHYDLLCALWLVVHKKQPRETMLASTHRVMS